MYEDSYLPYGAVPFPGYAMEDMAEFGAVPFPGYGPEDVAEFGVAIASARNINKLRQKISQAQAALKVAKGAGRKRRINRRIGRWKKQLKKIEARLKKRAGKGRGTRRFRKGQAAMKGDKARRGHKGQKGQKLKKAMNKKAIALYIQLRQGGVLSRPAVGQAVTEAYPPPYRQKGSVFLQQWASRNEGRFTMKKFGQQRFVPPARPRYRQAQTTPLPQRPRFRADMYDYEPEGAFQTAPSFMEDYSPPMEEEVTDLAPMEDDLIEEGEFEDEEFEFEEEKPFWQQPAFLIGAVIVAGGAYYLMADKKPKRKTTVKARAKKGGKAKATIRANRRRRNARRRTTRRSR